jgi:hypothetical protein
MEYRIAPGWKVFAHIFSIILLIGGLVCFVQAINPDTSWSVPLAWAGAVACIALAGYLYRYASRTLYVLDDQMLTITGPFRTRNIPLAGISGYRIGPKGRFYIVTAKQAWIGIPDSLDRSGELIAWFKGKYMDVDLLEQARDSEAILENEEFGFNRDERIRKRALAKNMDMAATALAVVVFLLAIFYSYAPGWIAAVLFVAPWVAVAATWYFKGLLKLYKKKKGAYPSVVQLMVASVFAALIFVALREYRIYAFDMAAWRMLAEVAVVAAVVCIMACRAAIVTSKNKPITYVLIFMVAAVYAFSLMIFYNCHYDTSPDKVYSVAVTGKRIRKGKSTSYHLSLSPWGRFIDGEEVSVSKSFYSELAKGDSVRILLNSGKLNIPWYRVTR